LAKTFKSKMFLDAAAADTVKVRVAGLEAASGVEVVAAVIARADSYPEVPWKAFALGASLAALAAAVMALFEPGWDASVAVVETAVAVLAVGGALGLGTVWITPFARVFIPAERREAEVRQYAQALFLEHGLHRTRRRDGILVLASLLEHQVVVLADRGVSEKCAAGEIDSVVATVTSALSRKSLADALLAGLEQLDGILARHGFRAQAGDTNELPDTVIQQRGPA